MMPDQLVFGSPVRVTRSHYLCNDVTLDHATFCNSVTPGDIPTKSLSSLLFDRSIPMKTATLV